METITVILAEDNAHMRRYLERFLGDAPEIVLLTSVTRGDEALKQAQEHCPDVLILDAEMPGMDGPDVAFALSECQSPVKILLISAHNNPAYIQGLLRQRSWSYVDKYEAHLVLASAVRRIAQGEHGHFRASAQESLLFAKEDR
ncbi:MAG: response regulator transcription factor [Anaerolineaceae bacterium]|nr:response regulator transcription factor [Anaerolineaceae bacterium]